MAFRYGDRIQETCAAPGTSAFTIGVTIPPGFLGFSSIASIATNDIVLYTAVDGTANVWETGVGTYSSGSLARTSVLSNSSGTTSKISFSNSVSVFCTILAETSGGIKLPYVSGRWYAPQTSFSSATANANYAYYHAIVIRHPVVVTKLGIVAASGTGSGTAISLAAYTDNGSLGGPTTVLASISLGSPTFSANTALQGTLSTPLLLTPGVYWLGAGFAASCGMYIANGTNQYGCNGLVDEVGAAGPFPASGSSTQIPAGYSTWSGSFAASPTITLNNGSPVISFQVQ
jgi:hypothetical protein